VNKTGSRIAFVSQWDSTHPPTRLSYLLTKNEGGVWGEDDDGYNGTIVLRSTEQFVDGSWNIVDPARRLLDPTERAKATLQNGDVVITKSSGSSLHIGKTSIVDPQVAALACCFSNFMQRLRCSDKLIPRFLFYVLNSPVGRQQMDFLSNSTTGLANLSGALIGSVLVPTPSVAVQCAIANFLDRETERIDELIAKKERLIQ